MLDEFLYGPFSREELFHLITRCVKMADTESLNPIWKRASLALADAADHLDGMTARITIYPSRVVEVTASSKFRMEQGDTADVETTQDFSDPVE